MNTMNMASQVNSMQYSSSSTLAMVHAVYYWDTFLAPLSYNPYEAISLENAICVNYTLQLSNSWDL